MILDFWFFAKQFLPSLLLRSPSLRTAGDLPDMSSIVQLDFHAMLAAAQHVSGSHNRATTGTLGKTDWICSGTIGHSQLVEAIFADVFTKVGSLEWYPSWTCLGSQIPRVLSICPSRT